MRRQKKTNWRKASTAKPRKATNMDERRKRIDRQKRTEDDR